MQRISITAKLNRSTLQFDEAAFACLEQYLAESAGLLEGDPDPQEILNDLEQAVVDQCTRRLPPGRDVVTLAELQPALAEIGSVQVPDSASPRESERTARPASSAGFAGTRAPLEQISEGAIIGGVCKGLARYSGLDVLALRIIAVLLLFASGGAMVIVYLGLMLLLPYAPLTSSATRLRWLPAKCRGFVSFVRAKLSAVAS